MANGPSQQARSDAPEETIAALLARRARRPHPGFRYRAWLAFQRALDPLAPPRPLRRPPR